MEYPLILVHGIAAVDKTRLFSFWGRIPKFLKERGIEVYLGMTDSWGDFETNAKKLKETIDRVLLKGNVEKVNIIAHSKGGIEARYLIHKYDYEEKIASLITISTPHLGSELADLALQNKIKHKIYVKKIMKSFGKLFNDDNPDPYEAIKELSTTSMREFNKQYELSSNIFFQAYYVCMHNPFDDLMFFWSYLYLKKAFGPNDGIVTEKSAKWNYNGIQFKGKKWGISHSEIVDIKRKKISGIDIRDLYKKVVEQIESQGL